MSNFRYLIECPVRLETSMELGPTDAPSASLLFQTVPSCPKNPQKIWQNRGVVVFTHPSLSRIISQPFMGLVEGT